MSREVPFDKSAKCDGCGAVGAFDFMGDYLCAECARKAIPSEKEPMTTQPTSPTPDDPGQGVHLVFDNDEYRGATEDEYNATLARFKAAIGGASKQVPTPEEIADNIVMLYVHDISSRSYGEIRNCIAAAIREAEERGRASVEPSDELVARRMQQVLNQTAVKQIEEAGVAFYKSAPPGHVLADTGEVLALPEGHVAVREGGKVVVKRLLGSLPTTADGCVMGAGARFYRRPTRSCPVVRERVNRDNAMDWTKEVYSTREAAEAARKGTPDAR